jgi:integrase
MKEGFMPKSVHKTLSGYKIRGLNKDGLYADVHNLYIQVRNNGVWKSWIYRYYADGKFKVIWLGSFSTLTLSDAREMAYDLNRQRAKKIDPYDQRKAEKAKPKVEIITFAKAAEDFIAERSAPWSKSHRDQWQQSLRDHAKGINKMSVADIAVKDVTRVLDQLWKDKPKTANRLRARIEAVLDWAKVRGFRDGENPARWELLKYVYSDPTEAQKAVNETNGKANNLPALPYAEISDFMASLRQLNSHAATALEFTILNASRISETLGLLWTEVDFAKRLVTIPPERMKNGREHRIPLSHLACDILFKQRAISSSKYCFPGESGAGMLNRTTVLKTLQRIRDDVTVHGFRATFKTWASESTQFPREIIEAAMSHYINVGTAEGAYPSC